MNTVQMYVTRLLTLIVIGLMAVDWKATNQIVVAARNAAKGQTTKTKALGAFGPVQVWLELDGKAWNIRVGLFSSSIAARLTNGAWGFNKKTIEALYTAYDEKYGDKPRSHHGDLNAWLCEVTRIAIANMVLPTFSIMERIRATLKRVDVKLGNGGLDDYSPLLNVVTTRYVGTKSINGKYKGTLAFSFKDSAISGDLCELFIANLAKHVEIFDINELKLIMHDLPYFFMKKANRVTPE